MNWVQFTILVSALLRFIGVAVAWELQVKLGKNRASYPTAPPFAPAGFFTIALLLAGNAVDLAARSFKVPPHPLLSGYLLTIAILTASAIGHYWLQASWLPPTVQQTIERHAAAWRGRGPCLAWKREKRRRQRLRARAEAAEARLRAAQAASRTKAAAHGEPVHDGVDAVIPTSLRERT